MDKGYDIIIYIVLGLIFVLVQVAKKKKKAAQIQDTDSENVGKNENQSPSTFFEQLLGVPEQNPVVQQPVINYQSPPEDLDPAFLQPGPSVSTDTFVNGPPETLAPLPRAVSVGYKKKKSSKRSGFDLRTAVIYKVVLERKNF